ncbi:MAG: M48 family metallopeptidase [Betaproteobacteria bacterium]
MRTLLLLYLVLRLGQQLLETALAVVNRRHATDPARLAAAGRALEIAEPDLRQAVAYSGDRHRFSLVQGWTEVTVGLAFLAAGGLGLVESWARAAAGTAGLGAIATGIFFFFLLAAASGTLALPFDLYSTFVIEERHGFNRQTLRGFLLDRLKGIAIGLALGTPLLAGLLWVMERMGAFWWLWAWGLVVAFNLFAVWIYPSVLAPLFNRFTPLPEGELRTGILELAGRTGFRAGGIFVMDASRRTAHGNAYFTGLFGQKRIVLFDTLVAAMAPQEVIAVLAHELGHFRLHHVRWAIARSVAASGTLFFVLSLALPVEAFYTAFSVEPTAYGALVVFGLWFSIAGFALQPLENALSRRHEFAADAFAVRHGAAPAELGAALRKLREKSRGLPVVHPLYSRVYHSHPPLLERLRAMGALYSPLSSAEGP